MAFFLISSMVLGLLDQLQIFSQLYLIELLGLLTRFGMLVFFTNSSLLEFFGQIFGLSSFLNNRQSRLVLDGMGSLEYLVNAGVPEGSILGLTVFLLYINDLPDNVV